MELLKFNLGSHLVMPKWTLIYSQCKNSRIRETPNLSTDADRSPNTKIELFFGGRRTYGHTEVWTNGRTYGRTKGRTHFTCQDITWYMSVQCNAIQPSSIVQFSTAVGWFTKKHKKTHYLKKIKLESWNSATSTGGKKKIVILCVNFDQFTEILVFKKVIKKWEKNNHLIGNFMSSLAKRNATTFYQKLFWPQEVKVLGWHKHTDTQTNTQTWRIVDGIFPEG